LTNPTPCRPDWQKIADQQLTNPPYSHAEPNDRIQNQSIIHPLGQTQRVLLYKLGGLRRRHHHKELPAAATLLLIRTGMYLTKESQKEKGDSCKMMIQLLIQNI
jgi:hypothetical protein